ncbi:tetratricopeptide repeat-containing glycosyltransferase family 2 protein, partial [Tepidibacillus decaturensis]
MKPFTISLCMIVKDEEKYLEKCLNSVHHMVDEIIIVDTGSSDSTLDIAERYKAKIFHFNWIDDFSVARNYSIAQATSDYILIMDADEYLEKDVNIFDDLKSSKDFYINRIKNYTENGVPSYHEAIRLFKNNIGLSYYGRIHEHLDLEGKNYSHAFSNILINHIGYKNEVLTEKNKTQRNIELLLNEVAENPSGYSYFNLAKQYMFMGELDKALHYFKESYYLSKNQYYLSDLLYHMVETLYKLKRYEDGIKVVTEAIGLFPLKTDLFFIKAKIFEELGFLEEAESLFKKCLSLGEVEHTSTREGVGSYLAHYYLSEVYQKQGKKLEAVEALFFALREKKNFPAALYSYIELLTTVNIPSEEIKRYLSAIYPITNQEEYSLLIKILYQLRHPLLIEYLEMYHNSNDQFLLAIAKQMNKQYREAYQIWNQLEAIKSEQIDDVIMLSLLLEDVTLLNKFRSSINVSDKERKILV